MAGISLDFLKQNKARDYSKAICRYGLLILFTPWFGLWAQLSPGALQQNHADLEGIENCTRCHEKGQQLNPQKCLNCHLILSNRIKNNKGLHSRPEYKECGNCHVEHQGRSAELIYWPEGQNHFSHQLTGYELKGKHATLQCRSCHTTRCINSINELRQQKINLDRTFLGLTPACQSCHRDEHRGQMRNECLTCHTLDSWKPALGFNHDHTTFPLTGLHRSMHCEKCHQRIQDNKYPDDADFLKFAGLKYDNCTRCHSDVHQNKFGTDCQHCHSTSGWKTIAQNNFNHDRTNFALRGRHALLNCERCHLPGKPLQILRYNNCSDCHSDYHQGQFSHRNRQGACEECHTVDGFSPANFTLADHQQTSYPLSGAHLAVPCVFCHKKVKTSSGQESRQFKFESKTCTTCHNDIHQGAVDGYLKNSSTRTGRDGCEYCHSFDGWKTVNFDHQQTGFTLNGRHSQISCSLCHQPVLKNNLPEKIIFKNTAQQCIGCHQDVHQGQFKSDSTEQVLCQRCHQPEGWQQLVFNHNRDARFTLQGAHQTVACNQCHPLVIENNRKFVRYKPLDTSCKACHSTEKTQNKLN